MKKSNTSQRLKEIMSQRGLRQVDILELCKPYCKEYDIKLGKNDLSQYVSGKASPKQNKLFVLSKALGVSEAWLMGFDTPNSGENEKDEQYGLNKFNKIINQLTPEQQENVRKYAEYLLSKQENE